MTDILDELRHAARTHQPRILFPEAQDERVVKAAVRVAETGIAHPVLLGADEATRRSYEEDGISLDRLEFLPEPGEHELTTYAEKYAAVRDVSTDVASQLLTDELTFGALLVRLREIDGMVAGAVHPTADVLAVANGIVGLAPGVDIGSSYFLMVFDEKSVGEDGALLYADCGVNIDPSAEELATIAVETATTAERLFDSGPRVAMLSFSTRGSASHEAAETVATAAELAAERKPDAMIDGELQADVALVPDVAERKVTESRKIHGNANVLVFPDLNAGNIAYKLTERLAGAKALGPILQGYARPVSDLSRGASVEDIVDVTAITAVASGRDLEEDGEVVQRGLLNRRESGVRETDA